MADYIVKDTELTSVANAIRTAGGTSSLLTFPNGFVNAINNISGGGGGSSDFSTAQVTLICNATNEVTCGLATVKEPMPPFVPQAETQSLFTLYGGDEFTITAVLYKGRCRFGALNATALSGTGDVQDITQLDAIITGDCTITIS